MAEEDSSLRKALDSIMGWPAGGTPAAPSTGAVPRSNVVNLGTSVTLENEVPPPAPDPFADELAALQASNAELSAQIAGTTTPAAATTAPASTGPAAPWTPGYEPSYTMPLQDYMNYINDFNQMEYRAEGGKGTWPKYSDYGAAGQTTMVDPLTGQSMSARGTRGATYRPASYSADIEWVPPK